MHVSKIIRKVSSSSFVYYTNPIIIERTSSHIKFKDSQQESGLIITLPLSDCQLEEIDGDG